jgi:integrase
VGLCSPTDSLDAGQRRGDLCALNWSAYDGATICLIIGQQKTRERMALPVHPALKAELGAWETQ